MWRSRADLTSRGVLRSALPTPLRPLVPTVVDIPALVSPPYTLRPMNADRPHPGLTLVPSTRPGRIGTWLALLGTALFVILLVIDALRTGSDPTRLPLLTAWVAILAGGALSLDAILRSRERAILTFLALLPAVLLLVAFAAEIIGVLE